MTRTQVRKCLPATFAWLYRNDRIWLDNNSPVKAKIIYENKRVNWKLRDIEILEEIKKAHLLLLQAMPITRITRNRIASEISRKALIEKHIDKIPFSKKYLEKISESTEAFQKRRILQSLEFLSRNNVEVKVWQVIRYSGLKKEFGQRLTLFIEKSIENYSLNFLKKVS